MVERKRERQKKNEEMNESRTKVICEYYGMENLDLCLEKLRRDNQTKKIYGKNIRLV